jgi:transposase
LGEVEILPLVERRRKWTEEEKGALLAEVEAEGGKVLVVARRHRVAESLLNTWRAAYKAAARRASEPMAFVPPGVVGRADDGGPALLAAQQAARPAEPPERRNTDDRVGMIGLDLPTGARLRVDAFVNETALARVLRVMKRAT